ncbi:MAG: hypothetical protein V4683_02075 [Bacteroidota bacterium]
MEKQIKKEDLTRAKGFFQNKYGYEMDNFSATMLLELKENFGKVQCDLEATIEKINEATGKINGSMKQIHFTNSKVAFWYAMGKGIPYSLAIIFSVLILYSAFIYWERRSAKTVEKVSKISRK